MKIYVHSTRWNWTIENLGNQSDDNDNKEMLVPVLTLLALYQPRKSTFLPPDIPIPRCKFGVGEHRKLKGRLHGWTERDRGEPLIMHRIIRRFSIL